MCDPGVFPGIPIIWPGVRGKGAQISFRHTVRTCARSAIWFAVVFFSDAIDPIGFKQLVFGELVANPSVRIVPVITYSRFAEPDCNGNHVSKWACFDRLPLGRTSPFWEESNEACTRRAYKIIVSTAIFCWSKISSLI